MTDASTHLRDLAAGRYDDAATELARVAAHLQTVAWHYRAWTAHSHIITARQEMDDSAVVHAAQSQP